MFGGGGGGVSSAPCWQMAEVLMDDLLSVIFRPSWVKGKVDPEEPKWLPTTSQHRPGRRRSPPEKPNGAFPHRMCSSVTVKALHSGWAVLSQRAGFFSAATEV